MRMKPARACPFSSIKFIIRMEIPLIMSIILGIAVQDSLVMASDLLYANYGGPNRETKKLFHGGGICLGYQGKTPNAIYEALPADVSRLLHGSPSKAQISNFNKDLNEKIMREALLWCQVEGKTLPAEALPLGLTSVVGIHSGETYSLWIDSGLGHMLTAEYFAMLSPGGGPFTSGFDIHKYFREKAREAKNSEQAVELAEKAVLKAGELYPSICAGIEVLLFDSKGTRQVKYRPV